MAVSIFNPSHGVQLPPPVFKAMFDSLERPLVVKGQLQPWMQAQSWKVTDVCSILGKHGEITTFKICPREGSESFKKRFKKNDPIFETQCDYVDATFTDFVEWLSVAQCQLNEPASKKLKIDTTASDHTPKFDGLSNPLLQYASSEYWVYADYKYMCHVCRDHPELLSAINWSLFGFDGCNGTESTLWIGSEGAFTPCHYDTYGCNIVAQLSGVKKWTLFSPTDSDYLYPTRLPYEESSVFSGVNVVSPDLEKYPLFQHTTAFTALLEPGDVLYVPKHWWHYVQSMGSEPTLSVNMWIQQESFPHERVKEAITRTLISQFTAHLAEPEVPPDWINPNEVILSTGENLKLLSKMVHDRKYQLTSTNCAADGRDSKSGSPSITNKTSSKRNIISGSDDPCTGSEHQQHQKQQSDIEIPSKKDITKREISMQDFVKAITDDKVVTLISNILLKNAHVL